MDQKFEFLKQKIPEDILQFLTGLRNKFRIKLTLKLLTQGSFSLSELSKITNVKNGYLISQLKILELSGIVQNFIQKKPDTNQYSFYEVTNFGSKIIKELITGYCDLLHFKGNLSDENDSKLYNELELLFKGLSNKFRFNLLLYLHENSPLSYSDLVNITKKDKSSVPNHIKKLEICGLIQNFFKKSDNTSDYSFYEITKLGDKIISNLLSSYHSYYQLKTTQNKSDVMKDSPNIDSQIFEAYCNSWLLPNEPILGWINILSKELCQIKMQLSKNLKIKEIYNCKYEIKDDQAITIKNDSEKNLKYISFDLFSKIPEGNDAINHETINISAYNKDFKLILKKELTIEVIKPLVKLNVLKKEVTGKSGFFEIQISIFKGFDVIIPTIEFKVEDIDGNLIKVKEEQKDPTEIMKKTLPGIKLENLIGAFEIKISGPLYFYFRVPYIDANNNKYYSNEEKIEVINERVFEGNLDYNCDYIQEVASI